MAFISKGKSKSSHSGRSSGSDSEEQRLRAYVHRFGLQQSSPTSASSSDSEHEEVSISSAGEKTAAPPALKKNPNSSDRSAVRTWSNPSEPNPNTPSASKAKKGVAAKRAKDDDFSEEQPESKKKKSVSEAKKAAAEEDDVDGEQSEPKKKSASKAKKGAVVKDDGAAEEKKSVSNGKKSVSNGKKPVSAEIGVPASNPHIKKPRKERQESAEATAAKVSSKKTARVWKADDENVIMLRYLVCVREGLEYSKNMQQFFQKMNDSLVHKASHTQLYEKVRNMKKRYRSLNNKIAQAQGRIKEDVFVYKSPHEKELYKLWKQAWGEQHEADGDVMHRPSSEEDQFCGDEDEEEEEEVESDGGTDTDNDKEPKVPRTEKAMVWNHNPVRPPVSSTPVLNNESEDRSVPIMKEIMDMLAEVTREVKKMTETSEAELKALLRAN